MNELSLLDTSNLYENTTVILGAGSLIMGLTLLSLRSALKNSGPRSKSGLIFLALAMFVLGIINLSEYVAGVDSNREQNSLSVLLFTSAVELFLMFMAYMSMLSKEFVTKRRIFFELGCIVLFTTPVCFVSLYSHTLLFNVLFAVGVVFYTVKLAGNYLVYRKQRRVLRMKMENYVSCDSQLWFRWIDNTFYVVITIGVVSVVAPMTNMTVLVFYNSFLFCAFLYIYISVIRNISIFDSSTSILDGDQEDVGYTEGIDNDPSQYYLQKKSTASFIPFRQHLLDDWIAARGYTVAGVTASEVAARLKISRTKLSYYLKNELNTTYYEWIAKLRIEDAKRQLIESPDRAIYEIAINVGIDDRDNFRRIFQRIAGVPPTTYRKEHVGDF